MASSHDLDLWKFMINGNCFRKLVDTTASAVLVVGPMGAGKSTTIGIQTGAKYEAVKEEASRIKVTIYGFPPPGVKSNRPDEQL